MYILFAWTGWGPLALVPLFLGCCGAVLPTGFLPGADAGVHTLAGGLSSGAVFVISAILLRFIDRRLNHDPHRRYSDHTMWNVPLGMWSVVYWVFGIAIAVIGAGAGIAQL